MATTSRRLQSRQPSKTTKTGSVTADQLANELATKLTIGSGKGKQKAEEGDTKMLSMRSVNTASQALTQVVQAGWKKSSSDASKTTLSSINSSASAAAKGLSNLRKICPGDLDVERAASSVLGKLIALEMFDPAETALSEMHPRICQLINAAHHEDTLLSLPEPSSPLSNPIILNLISTYLLHVLIIKTQPDRATSKSVEELASLLASPTTRSLLPWFPNFASLPAKHTDNLLTRAYSTVTKLCSSFSTTPNKSDPKFKVQIPSPESFFTLRAYALRCLCHTSPGVIQPGTFWDQATSFAATLARASPKSSEDQATRLVLDAYSEIASLVMKRSDREIFAGVDVKGFLAFCDYWTSFAKRAGDIYLLQKISLLMQPHPTSSPTPPIEDSSTKLPLESQIDVRSPQAVILEGTKCYNAFAQITVLLEDTGKPENVEDLASSTSNCTALLRTSATLPFLLQPVTPTNERRSRDEEAASRICGKVDRAFEKMRRHSMKFIESNTSIPASRSSRSGIVILLRELLLECVSALESLSTLPTLSAASMRDVLTRTLDTLFVLSRTGLIVNDPTTFVPAFEHLSRAVRILDSIPSDRFPLSPIEETVDIANYTRCVSGAFYNLAGSLYQVSKYGNAVPFLVKSCELGGKALRLPRIQQRVPNEARDMEWAQLEEQLFRRWELLAVCYSKNGDRKNAHFAFKQAIHKFPFQSSGLLAQTDTVAPDSLFGASSSSAVKQLVGLVDRVSYLGACELLLPPEDVSLLAAINVASSEVASHNADPAELNPVVTGALLERQLDSLEPSRWKDGVRGVFIQLLKDSLQIYSVSTSPDAERMPVRRARVLVRCMEFAYHDQGSDACSEIGCGSVQEMALQIEDLASRQDLGRDTSLTHYLLQYRISAHLWVSLHAHRRVDPLQYTILSQQAEDACRLMRQLLNQGSQRSPKISRKGISPKATAKSPKLPEVSKVVSPARTRVTRQRVPAAPRKPAVVAKTKAVMKPVTPKPRTRTALQPVSFNVNQTPPRRSVDGTQAAKPPLIFDNFDQFFSLLQLVTRILGLLSLVLPKAHLLDMTRKLAQRHFGTNNDGYVIASLELAHEYVTLGKMKRAITIFNQALEIVRRGEVSDEAAVRFLLRFAESLAVFEDVPKSSSVYLEALERSRQLDLEQRAQSTQQRIHARAKMLEIAATAAYVFALVQHTKGDVCASLNGLLQSLRLWNRAVETLARLHPPTRNANSSTETDPFEMSDLKEVLPGNTPAQASTTKKAAPRRPPIDGMEWRISEGLLSTIFALTEAYYLRGSAREADYFARQAVELAEELNVPAVHARALARRGEVQLHTNNLGDAWASISKAAELVCDSPGIDTAEIRRLKAEYSSRTEDEQEQGGAAAFEETVAMLEELDASFRQFDSLAFGPRRSVGASPGAKDNHEVLAPDVLAALLSHQLWLLRDDVGDEFNTLLEKFISLSRSSRSKAEQNILMAKLTLHGVYGRFQADMFLSSLTESTIAVPMGMGSRTDIRVPTLPSVEVLDALASAEKLLWAHVGIAATTGNVIKIRETAMSLVLISAFRTSLGDRTIDGPTIMAALMDVSAALSLRRDMLEAIGHKFIPKQPTNDLQWPLLSGDGTHLPQSPVATKFTLEFDSNDEDDSTSKLEVIQNYWNTIRTKHQSQVLNPSSLTSLETAGLPDTWTIINFSVTPDKGTLFISRQDGGVQANEPLVFCIPLTGRRDHGNGDDEEEHLTFESAIRELQDIVRSSDECTKSAVNIKADDEEARVSWWKQRGELDLRMKQLLENIEYCWLGAFKAILSPRPDISPEATSELRGQFEKIFYRCLHVKEKKPKLKGSAHKKSVSQAQTFTATQFSLDDCIVKCFSTLSPKCRDEELEDLVYFILDLYQFHGVPIAIAEVDIDQVVVDLRMMLEEYNAKATKQTKSSRPASKAVDEHFFLVLDKNIQGLPWESLPILRGRSISRVPGVQFLLDRLAFAKCKRESAGQPHDPRFGAAIDPRKGYYILNPSKDLSKTEERFRDWAQNMKKAGWGGVIGQPISEQQFINALETQDLVVYFGHGGGEQYAPSHRIRSLPTCAATMLWGCSSGALREMGDFDRTGTPYNYMLAGCPTLVANLWDVTDKDIDKLSQSVLDKLHLTGKELNQLMEKRSRDPVSLVAAVAQSRDSCKLKYLTGAAPVVYGIPFYL